MLGSSQCIGRKEKECRGRERSPGTDSSNGRGNHPHCWGLCCHLTPDLSPPLHPATALSGHSPSASSPPATGLSYFLSSCFLTPPSPSLCRSLPLSLSLYLSRARLPFALLLLALLFFFPFFSHLSFVPLLSTPPPSCPLNYFIPLRCCQ
jgi:hypothetical protein